MINWHPLEDTDQLQEIIAASASAPIVIFKHSTRCSVSSMALSRLERAWQQESEVKPYFLDLVRYRDLSRLVAEEFGIRHESPQLLLIKDGRCVYHTSHMGISYQALQDALD
jgi:bacillithiol system protein YtxJ